ncbi:FliM/FliN family flagellar motor switch protein [Aurantimonas sp. MSK8Z-1]|uniref:FliM/FliN family flagellar motor switch protein n=1 Tax=Mangrovibrevibacter kandeliae TaxID=2968473 RepID=UPI0021196073|nr:FliM/FliN family flagellar motor switch protein [Aurantimonas sp. MSK8Z-1]MCW4113689.1 FliM/FliN family flagellar motor switch protein [Aurantimonas sp. MSK8Z-1]
MSALPQETVASGNIGARLRSASEVEPSRLPRLKVIVQKWAESAGESMAGLSVSPVIVELVSMSAMTFLKQSKDYQQASLAAVVNSSGWSEPGFVLVDASFDDVLLEAFFGGDGGTAETRDRVLTDLDKGVVELALKTINRAGNAAFRDIEPIQMVAKDLIQRDIGEALAAVLPGEKTRYVSVTFDIKLGALRSSLRYAIPESFIAANRRHLSHVPEVKAPPDESWVKKFQKGFNHSELKVRAVLGKKQLRLDEVSRFAVGHTIVLDETMDSLIDIECEDQRLFRGRVGRSRDFYVVQVEERVDPTEEFIDDILAD